MTPHGPRWALEQNYHTSAAHRSNGQTKGVPTGLEHLHRPPCCLIQILHRQPENFVGRGHRIRKVRHSIVLPEHPPIQRLGEPRYEALGVLLLAIRNPLLDRLVRDLPVGVSRPQHAVQTIEHVPLRHAEAVDAEILALEVGDGWRRSRFGEAEQSSQCAPTLSPGAHRDGATPVVEERHLAGLDREAEPLLAGREAPLVPKAAGEADRRRHAITADVVDPGADQVVEDRFVFFGVLQDRVPEGVGHDVGHTGLAGGHSDAVMEVEWRLDAEGDDEELLAAQGVDYRRFVVIVYFDAMHAVGLLPMAAVTSQACDGMFAGLHECFGKGTTNTASRLQGSVPVSK